MGAKIVVAACMMATLSMQADARDIRDQWNIQISKAELVFPGTPPHDAANGIKDALSQFAIPANLSYRAMPSSPPARPGVPKLKQMATSVPSPEYVCEDSYAEITKRPPPVQNAFAFIAEGHQICLYSFAKGVKAYVIYYNMKKTESLTSGLFNGITRAIRGSDEDRATSQLTENIEAIRAKLPGVLVERIEIPGRPAETPDLEAVAALIPLAEAVTPMVISAPAQVVPATAVANSPLQAKVEARKNLNAMGMTYHSQQQFVEAIRRKDDVAVHLFIEGGGVSLDATDGNGQTPLQVAHAHSSTEILALLQPKPQPASSVPAIGVLNARAPVATAAPAILQPAAPDAQAVDFAKIPAELLAEIDGEVSRMNLSPDEKQLARANLVRQYLKVKALANALN
jgi:hypothetical protein